MREVVDSQVLLIRETGIRVDAALHPGGLPVDADPALVHQALANLLNNALKYSPQGRTVTIRSGRREGPSGAPSVAWVSVHDAGRGVAPEERERIFDEFYRARTVENQQVKGSGLGLTIAKEIVEIHGGRILYDAPPEGGSVFAFEIPSQV